jgi:hypothetical protein
MNICSLAKNPELYYPMMLLCLTLRTLDICSIFAFPHHHFFRKNAVANGR